MHTATINVTVDAGEVVMEFIDMAYPDRPLRWRISPHEAAHLSAALAAAADTIEPT